MFPNSYLQLVMTAFLVSCVSQKGAAPLAKDPADIAPVAESRSDAQLTEEQYVRLTKAVYEIIAPRMEDKDVVYQEALPEHLLPYKLRKSPYRGIGTAFAVGANRFVSAAHVFDLHQPTQITPLSLRDTNGKIFQIDQVLRYSQHRDLIEFSLKNPPTDILPLKIAKESRMGQYVLTVGNALGDGIVTRSGYITSFTPEPINGEWNDIRYSAPASPGNSGGPLLNKNLEVVGIVVRRTENENLNFGIPITELEKTKEAAFFLQDVKIEQYKQQLARDWNFSTKVPATPATISQLAAADYLKFQAKLYTDFQSKFKNEIFPTDPHLKTWAKDSLATSLAGYIQKDNNENWITAPVDWNIIKLEKYRSIVIEKGAERSDTTLFMLERPLNQKLVDFYQDPKSILDTYFKQIGWARNYMGRRIGIKSYGKPKWANQWTDNFGRKWWSWEWNTVFDDRNIQLTCMPMPAGMFCVFNADPFRMRELSRQSIKRAINRFMIDVYGKVKDWRDWKDIPEEYKQSFIPKNVEMTLTTKPKTQLSWQAGRFSGKTNESEFDENAEMALSFISSPENIFKLRLRNVQVVEKDGDIQLGSGVNFKPDEEGNPSYREVWDKMLDRRAPYNGQAQIQGKHSLIVNLLGKTQNPKKVTQIGFTTCGVLSSVGDSKIKNICQSFYQSVKLSDVQPAE